MTLDEEAAGAGEENRTLSQNKKKIILYRVFKKNQPMNAEEKKQLKKKQKGRKVDGKK